MASRTDVAVRQTERSEMESSAEYDQRVMSIVALAIRQEPAGRESFLREVCQNDHQLYLQFMPARGSVTAGAGGPR
jgi:hypothetical protein